MRCSICMSQLIEKDDTVICPNCQSVHGAAAIAAYQSDFDDNIEKPDSFVARMFRTLSWTFGILFLLAVGGIGGWTLRGNGASLDDVNLVRVAVSAFENKDGQQSKESGASVQLAEARFERLLFAPHPNLDDLMVVGIQENGEAYSFKSTLSGTARQAELLSSPIDNSSVAAAQFSDGTLALLGEAGGKLAVAAWSSESSLLWQTELNSDLDSSGTVKMHALGAGVVLVARDKVRNKTVAYKVTRDGQIVWETDLGHSEIEHLSLYGSPFDELVAVSRTSSTSTSLQVQSFTLDGLSGFSAEFPVQANEQILAATVDPIGQIQILLSGAPPRLLTQDALGRASQSRTLDGLHAIPSQTPCLLEGRAQHLRVACTQNETLQDSVLNLTNASPEVELRNSSPLGISAQLIAIQDNTLIAVENTSTGTFKAKTIGLNAIPDPGDVSIPGDVAVGLP